MLFKVQLILFVQTFVFFAFFAFAKTSVAFYIFPCVCIFRQKLGWIVFQKLFKLNLQTVMLNKRMSVVKLPCFVITFQFTKSLKVTNAKLCNLCNLLFCWTIIKLRIQFLYFPIIINPGIIQDCCFLYFRI